MAGLKTTGGDAARLRRIVHLQKDLRGQLDAARAIHETQHAARARELLRTRRFKQLVSAGRALITKQMRLKSVDPSFPLKRRTAGFYLLYRICELERTCLSRLGHKREEADYEELLTGMRDELSLSAAWDPFIRICIWYDTPSLARASRAEGSNDVPILPLYFDESTLSATAILEGNESDDVGRRALIFCRKFQELRRLTAERLRPKRSSFKAHRRKMTAKFFRENPGASYLDAWRWYGASAPVTDRDVDFEAFRRTVRQGQRKRRNKPGILKSLTLSGDEHLGNQ